MKKAAKPEGHVIILDYNLDETRWVPEPPADFQRFYRAFLDWRTANKWTTGWPRILPDSFTQQGWLILRVTRPRKLFDAAIPIFSTLTRPEFGST